MTKKTFTRFAEQGQDLGGGVTVAAVVTHKNNRKSITLKDAFGTVQQFELGARQYVDVYRVGTYGQLV